MRILILTQYYDPEPVIYPHQLARGLMERGHEVRVLTGFPNYPKGQIYPPYKQKIWHKEEMDGVPVVRLPLYPDHSLTSAQRAFYYLSFAFSSLTLGAFHWGKADLLFVFHPLSLGFVACLIGFLKGLPFVYNVQDMYPESLRSVGFTDQSRIFRTVGKFADLVYRKAAAISVISKGFKENLIEKGVAAEKIQVIYNWANDAVYFPAPKNEALAAELGMGDRFNVVYAGNMGPPQGLESVIEAAALLNDLPLVQFLFIGDGNQRTKLEDSLKSKGLKNVRFIPWQPAAKMPFIYALADALLVHLIDDPLFAITIPQKTQSYLACGRPILMAVKGDAAELVRQAGAGLCAEPSNPFSIARVVREMTALQPEERDAMGMAGRRFYQENLASEVQINNYESLFNKILMNPRVS